MKVLFAYASKTGTAEECAGILQKELRGADVTVADLAREKPDVRGFDAAVIGGSVRYGKLRRDAADYLTAQQDALATVPHGLFLCMSSGHEFEEISEKVFPAALRESAFAVMNFGGRLRLKRAGLDYWHLVEVSTYENLAALFEQHPEAAADCWLATTKAPQDYCEAEFHDGCWLFFGKETAGLPEDFRLAHYERCIRLPMRAEARSLNLSNSVAILTYEALKQLGFPGLKSTGEMAEQPD